MPASSRSKPTPSSVDTVIENGGQQVLENTQPYIGGIANGTVIKPGRLELINNGGTDVGGQISGGAQYDYGLTSGDTIYAGLQAVEAGGIASGTTIAGGTLEVMSGSAGDHLAAREIETRNSGMTRKTRTLPAETGAGSPEQWPR
jgi:autotransporter passenger strand-loop-strand repeat protein